ncbi:hypothetical protein BGX29_008312 [Mortierella sp. GBA35]|nr:hypothetical protein BGX29_008312 [Mortierella sp. GBA35]
MMPNPSLLVFLRKTPSQNSYSGWSIRLGCLSENLPKPVVKSELSAIQDLIEHTQQLVYCKILLLKGSAAATINDVLQDNDSQESVLDETERAWLKAVQQHPVQQHPVQQLHVRWLTNKLAEEFVKDDLKGPATIAEAVILGPILDRGTYRSLLSCFVTKIEQTTILDVALLQGLVQLIESASPGYLEDDDLFLNGIKNTTDPILQFQVAYALQALHLDTLQQAAGQSYEVTKSILEGMEASQRGRFGAIQSLLKGFRAGTKHEWFLILLRVKKTRNR